MHSTLTIATRGSQLALWQAEFIAARLREHDPGLAVNLKVVKTMGDTILDKPLAKLGGKGLFVKEIEEAILAGQADLAVHSLKDVPGELVPELTLGVIPKRGDPTDTLVSLEYSDLDSLPAGGVVGTGSLRRQAQILSFRPDVQIKNLRGNLNTRIRKLERGDYQAIILASAGLQRLGVRVGHQYRLGPPDFLPAVGQGALGIEYKRDNQELARLLAVLDHEPSGITTRAERAFLRELEGSCQVPLGAFAELKDGSIHLSGFVSDLSGQSLIRKSGTGDVHTPEALGRDVARRIIAAGGREILDRVCLT
ncbi:MAG: hydroxymethylbilane synthase [Desulfohalobiaceae bacterium]|nr:hydroxymethylbilane synthase [Desulfohalobiaceae bacterium]